VEKRGQKREDRTGESKEERRAAQNGLNNIHAIGRSIHPCILSYHIISYLILSYVPSDAVRIL
jgi:hypothetical protein